VGESTPCNREHDRIDNSVEHPLCCLYMTMTRLTILLALMAIAALLGACSFLPGGNAQPTPTSISGPTPPPRPTPAPTVTPVPTVTATPTPIPPPALKLTLDDVRQLVFLQVRSCADQVSTASATAAKVAVIVTSTYGKEQGQWVSEATSNDGKLSFGRWGVVDATGEVSPLDGTAKSVAMPETICTEPLATLVKQPSPPKLLHPNRTSDEVRQLISLQVRSCVDQVSSAGGPKLGVVVTLSPYNQAQGKWEGVAVSNDGKLSFGRWGVLDVTGQVSPLDSTASSLTMPDTICAAPETTVVPGAVPPKFLHPNRTSDEVRQLIFLQVRSCADQVSTASGIKLGVVVTLSSYTQAKGTWEGAAASDDGKLSFGRWGVLDATGEVLPLDSTASSLTMPDTICAEPVATLVKGPAPPKLLHPGRTPNEVKQLISLRVRSCADQVSAASGAKFEVVVTLSSYNQAQGQWEGAATSNDGKLSLGRWGVVDATGEVAPLDATANAIAIPDTICAEPVTPATNGAVPPNFLHPKRTSDQVRQLISLQVQSCADQITTASGAKLEVVVTLSPYNQPQGTWEGVAASNDGKVSFGRWRVLDATGQVSPLDGTAISITTPGTICAQPVTTVVQGAGPPKFLHPNRTSDEVRQLIFLQVRPCADQVSPTTAAKLEVAVTLSPYDQAQGAWEGVAVSNDGKLGFGRWKVMDVSGAVSPLDSTASSIAMPTTICAVPVATLVKGAVPPIFLQTKGVGQSVATATEAAFQVWVQMYGCYAEIPLLASFVGNLYRPDHWVVEGKSASTLYGLWLVDGQTGAISPLDKVADDAATVKRNSPGCMRTRVSFPAGFPNASFPGGLTGERAELRVWAAVYDCFVPTPDRASFKAYGGSPQVWLVEGRATVGLITVYYGLWLVDARTANITAWDSLAVSTAPNSCFKAP